MKGLVGKNESERKEQKGMNECDIDVEDTMVMSDRKRTAILNEPWILTTLCNSFQRGKI